MLRSISIIFVALAFSSCSSGSFVGKRVDNFTAYYNTFYNAERVFEDAEKAVKVKDPPVNREVYLDVFVTPDRVSNRQNFDSSIKKSADVLREHDNSKWVDDALLLIGKSNFYTQNYVSAQRYFLNVIEVSTKLDGEAHAWLGRSYIAAGQYEDAIDHLTSTLASDDLSRKWAPTLKLELGDVYVRTGQYELAAAQLQSGIETSKDKDLRARASFLLGQVYETIGDTTAAIASYNKAARYEALYELSFAGQFKTIELLASTDPQEASKLLRKMERDDKNFNYAGQLDYLRARVLMEQENWVEARDHLKAMLDGTNRLDQVSSGNAHYALGEIYENHLVDYSLAAAHYDTASTNLKTYVQQARTDAIRAKISDPFAPGANTDATEKAEIFGAFANAYAQVARVDSLLELGSLDNAAFEARIQELRRLRLEEMEAQRKRSERRAIEQEFRNTGGASVRGADGERKGGEDNFSAGGVGTSTESGFLYHKDPIRMKAGVQNFIELWGNRPLVDNWRIESKLISVTADAVADGRQGPAGRDPVSLANIEFLPTIDVSDVPRSPAAKLAAREERAEARYLVGNVLFLSMNLPDSAAHWYNLVVQDDSEFDVSQRALYALIETHRAVGDMAAANDLEKQLLQRFPDSEFALRLSRSDSPTASTDSTVVDETEIEAQYDLAFTEWVDRGEHEQAFHMMLDVAASHPNSGPAPRALFAATAIYHEWARANDIDPLTQIRFQVSDSVIALLGIPRRSTIDSVAVNPVVDSLAVEQEIPQAMVDPDAIIADTTLSEAVEADSTELNAGGLGAPEDGNVAVDSLDARSDTLAELDRVSESLSELQKPDLPNDVKDNSELDAAAPDGDVVEPLAAGDSLIVSADSSSVLLDGSGVYLTDLFKLIEDQYAGSKYAAQVAKLVLTGEREADLADAASTSQAGRVEQASKSSRVNDGADAKGKPVVDRGGPVPGEERRPSKGLDESEVVRPGEIAREGEGESQPIQGVSPEELSSEPIVIGGMPSLERRIRFPEDTGNHPNGGIVIVEFVVSHDGFVKDPSVVAGLSGGFGEEALRVILETRFRPAVNKKAQPVPFRMQLEIPFERKVQ